MAGILDAYGSAYMLIILKSTKRRPVLDVNLTSAVKMGDEPIFAVTGSRL